jgi:subfamily B ATP-binding cassette protein MsbA
MIGDWGIKLSGGQKQRIFIARELYRRPSLLILDEATSALDSQSEQAIKRTIDALHGKITIILIAHRISTIKNVDEIFVIDEGRLVEQGSYACLAQNPTSKLNQLIKLQTL